MTCRLGIINLFVSVGLVASVCAKTSNLQKPVSVEKIVETEIITNQDVDDRILLITFGKKETKSSFRAMVLEMISNEKILQHVAEKAGIRVSDEAIQKALANVAQSNGMTPEQMQKSFAEKGIPLKSLKSMMKSQLAWREYIQSRRGGTVHVSEAEIDTAMQKMLQQGGQSLYSYIEVFLPVASKDQEEKVRANAEDVASQLRQSDANASMIAQQFSKAASAQRGGKVTQIPASQVDAALIPTLNTMDINAVSAPVRLHDGFVVVKLTERQAGKKESAKEDEEVTLHQAAVQLNDSTPQEHVERLKSYIGGLLETRGCKAFDEKVKSFGGDVVVAQKKLSEFPPELATIIKKTPVGQCVQPISIENGVLVMMLCKLEKVKFKMPTRDEVSHMLEEEKFRKIEQSERRKYISVAHTETPKPSQTRSD